MKDKKRRIYLLIFALILLIFSSFGILSIYMFTPYKSGEDLKKIEIRKGQSLKSISLMLKREGIISNSTLFTLAVQILGGEGNIKAGEYMLSARFSPYKIFQILNGGKILTYNITIPEGYNIREIAELLHRKGIVKKERFLKLVKDPKLISRYGINSSTLEGYLFPDTYRFSKGLEEERVIEMMVKRFWQKITPLLSRVKRSGMSLSEVIILASIVEKETSLSKERPLVASVFLNRLRKGMKLESDPTVIYGLKRFSGDLKKEDLRNPHPYNTYIYKGLPPTPICNPGLSSIKAVLNPSHTEYLFFVSKNDGSHFFSKTLREHLKAVGRYQLGK